MSATPYLLACAGAVFGGVSFAAVVRWRERRRTTARRALASIFRASTLCRRIELIDVTTRPPIEPGRAS